MPNDLKFKVKFRVPNSIIYEALTNEELINKYTQSPTKFENKSGGEFSLYDGFITGTNLELVENQSIIQTWKFNTWTEFAELTILIKPTSGSECTVFLHFKNIQERDNQKNMIELKSLEEGYRSQIFQKISDWMGYPQNKDESEEEDD